MSLFRGGPDYTEIEGLPGFVRAEGGLVSGGVDPFLGLSDPDRATTGRDAARRRIQSDFLHSLFGPVPDGQLPVASFSDYHCPFCRVLTQKLADMATSEGLHLRWHEWPILGPQSVAAAKAALAADRQGLYAAFHKRLMRSRFVAEPDVLRGLALDIGARPDQLLNDMAGPAVARQLAVSDALANRLGFVGTPAMVIGGIVVVGRMSDHALHQMLQDAREVWPNVAQEIG